MTSIALDLNEPDEDDLPADDVATSDDLETPDPVEAIDEPEPDEPDALPTPDGDESPTVEAAAPAETSPPDSAHSASTPAAAEEPSEPVVLPIEGGGSYTLPGAVFNPTRNSLDFKDVRGAQRAHTLMRLGVWAEVEGRKQIERLEVKLQKEVEAAKTDAQQLWDAFAEIMTLPDGQFDQRILEFRAQFPELRYTLETSRLKQQIAQLEGSRGQPEPALELPETYVAEWAEREAADRIRKDFETKQYPWMTEQAVAHLSAAMAESRQHYTYLDASGTPRIDQDRWNRVASHHAAAWQAAHQAAEAAKKAAAKTVQTLSKPARDNSKILAQTKPPTGTPATVAPSRPKPLTRAQLDAEIAEARRELARNMNGNSRRHETGAGLIRR